MVYEISSQNENKTEKMFTNFLATNVNESLLNKRVKNSDFIVVQMHFFLTSIWLSKKYLDPQIEI